MISDEKIKVILKEILEKEQEMLQDKETYKNNKDKEREIKRIIERLVKIDEI